MVTVPRLLRPFVRPDRDYRLYGLHYWAHRTISRMTNRHFFTRLFGDSYFIVYYLRSIGYDLSKFEQTGSNFGTDVKHDNPFLSTVGRGTVVADGLSFINADYSSTHFRVARVRIGAQSFLGNGIAYPAQGRTGDNCLLATKVMIPLDGPVREGVGLLGSPSFEIPRTVDRDHQLDVTDPDQLRRKLIAKRRHNTVTILLFLLSRWLHTSMLTVLALATVDLYSEFGVLVAAVAGLVTLPLSLIYFLLLDRLVRGLQAFRPNGCSIYDRAFWRHERFWKVCSDGYIQLFNGTPFKGVVWRLLGAKVGRRVFDDGCAFTERSFVTIGERCTLNAGSTIQCHSQEDGAFKSDRSSIGSWMHARGGRLRPLRRHGQGRRAAGARLVPDEGLGGAGQRAVGREPGRGGRRPHRARPPRLRMTSDNPPGWIPGAERASSAGRKDTMESGAAAARAHWLRVLATGGNTVIPRWTTARERDMGEQVSAIPADVVAAVREQLR